MKLMLKFCAATASLLLASGLFAQNYTTTSSNGQVVQHNTSMPFSEGYTQYSENNNGYNSTYGNGYGYNNTSSYGSNSSYTPSVYQYSQSNAGYNTYNAGYAQTNTSSASCGVQQPATTCDQQVAGCWCRYVHWQPCPYQTTRCVEEQVPCEKKCCRMVPKYYQVQQCKYVPQYYTVTVCRNEPEYYTEPDCKTVTRTVCDQHCRYVPQYYWKYTCDNTSNANVAAPQAY